MNIQTVVLVWYGTFKHYNANLDHKASLRGEKDFTEYAIVKNSIKNCIYMARF